MLPCRLSCSVEFHRDIGSLCHMYRRGNTILFHRLFGSDLAARVESYAALLDVWTGHHGIHPLTNTRGAFKFRTGYPAYINSMNNRYLNLYSAGYVSS